MKWIIACSLLLVAGLESHEVALGLADPALVEGIYFAAEKHRGQCRKNAAKTPYIVHPIGVAELLWHVGEVRDRDVLLAGILHDVLEDTHATEDEIGALFGNRVLSIVKEVTNDPSVPKAQIKQWQVDHAPTMSHEAKLVKLADRLYNCRSLRLTPPDWDEERIQAYMAWGQKLLVALSGTSQKLEEALSLQVAQSK